jgi:hypothetical protein
VGIFSGDVVSMLGYQVGEDARVGVEGRGACTTTRKVSDTRGGGIGGGQEVNAGDPTQRVRE